MSSKFPLTYLADAVNSSAAAFRCRVTLQPAGGVGDKVFPPTCAGAVYAIEQRQIFDVDGKNPQTKTCVVLDSVQAQANRMEEALQAALDAGKIKVPVLSVDFTGLGLLDEVGRVTSLEAPHRVADAILRDSLHEGIAFRKSDLGKQLDAASLQNATPLYQLCPTALVFGIWDSTGPKGGLGAKFQRALTSEIIGVNAQVGKKTSSRIDPLGMRAAAKVIKKDGTYELASDKAPGAVSPSEVNHGNIPPDISNGGATIDYADQIIVLSLPALRRLRFPVDGKVTAERDTAARTVLVALALTSAALAAESGFDLRSRCLLWPTGPLTWELLKTPGQEPEKHVITSEVAIALLNEAVGQAEKLGLKWHGDPITLKPAPNLIALLKRSQEIAASTTEPSGT
ncbi:CRISPR-associated Csx4 family protein [Roseimicrobium gellanilyticum]|uniref:CRISPR-associated Csx4 family protein n=1 Tax=Roseimicrobium gellanilyticum TaxID=748857 RepID=A0A366H7I6_9BACT|nr:CRISPR-associated Csx4 family protein [Roseimicrobium gellanilyticum]